MTLGRKDSFERTPLGKRKNSLLGIHSTRLALEPRLVFDAAAVATAVEVLDTAHDTAGYDAQHDAAADPAPAGEAPAPAGEPSAPTLVVVDERAAERDALLASAGAGRQVLVIGAGNDPVSVISAVMQDRTGIEAVHLVGAPDGTGTRLGSMPLTDAIVSGRAEEVMGWRDGFADGADIHVHGTGAEAEALARTLGDLTGADADVAAEPPATGRTLIIIDSRVEDADALLHDAAPEAEIVRVGSGEDGIAAITRALEKGGVSSLQIVAHGSAGTLQIGSDTLTLDAMEGDLGGAVAGWGLGLDAEADILLLGCNVGEGEDGRAFVERLAFLTGADVAASADNTGSAERGGDWDLEIRTGRIESALALDAAALAGYGHLLAAPTISDSVPFIRFQPEDTDMVITGITVADADPSDTTLRVSLSVNVGTITLSRVTGLTFNAGTANGSSSIDVSGSIADINAALAGMTYRMGQDAYGLATLSITATDASLASSTRTVYLAVTPVNDAPVLVAPGLTVAEGQTGVAFSPASLSVTDVDNLPEQVMIRIDSLPTKGTLRFNGFGVVVGSTFSLSDLAKLTYSHGGTDVAVGDSDHFSVSVNDGAGGYDGAGSWSASQPVTISLTPVNQAPEVGFTPGGTFYEGRPSVPVGLTITDRESGHADSLASTTVEIRSLDLGGEGVLYLDANGNDVIDDGEMVTVGRTFTGLEAAQLKFSHFGGETNLATPPSFTVRVTDAGGGQGAGGALHTDHQIVIPVVPVNDDPVLAVNEPLVVEAGTTTKVITTAELSVTDIDTLNGNLLVYMLESRPTQGVIQVNADRTGGENWKTLGIGGRFTQQDVEMGRVRYVHQGAGPETTDSFTFSVRDSMYQAWPSPDTPGAVYDGSTIAINTFTIDIAAAADGNGTISNPDPGYGGVPPDEQDPGGGEGGEGGEGGGPGGGGPGGSPSDPGNAPTPTPVSMTNNNHQGASAVIPSEGDGGEFNQSMLHYRFETAGYVVPDSEVVYTVTAQPENGRLELKVGGVWKAIHDYGTFTQEDINLGNIRFVHDGGENFRSSFTYIVSDGGPHSLTSTFGIEVIPTNDRPVATAGTTVTITEGGIVRISDRHIQISDEDLALQVDKQVGDGAKDDLWFRITTLPVNGELQRWNGTGWVALTSNDWLTADALTATGIDGGTGALRYVHGGGDQDANFLDGFTVEVRDDLGPPAEAWSIQAGLAAPAADNLSDTASIVIEIAPMNDAPEVALTPDAADPVIVDSSGTTRTGVNTPLTVFEGQENVSLKDHLAAVDPDNTSVQRQFRITDATDNGTIRLSGVTLGVGSVFTQADLDAGRITYTHDGSETVSDSFSFVVSDGVDETAVARFDIIVTSTNDLPTVSGPGTIAHGSPDPISFTGGNAISFEDLDLVVVEGNEENFVQVTVDAQNPNARLNVDETIAGLTVIQGDGVRGEKLIIQGTAEAVQQALDGLTLEFVDINEDPADVDAAVSVTVTVDDRLRDAAGNLTGGANGGPVNEDGSPIDDASNVATHTFTVYASATPDDPTFANIPSGLSVNEEATLSFTDANRIEIADVDAFPIASATGSIRLQAGNGNLTIGSLNGATVTAGGNGSGDITLTGTLAQLNAALLTLTYTGKLNYTNTVTPDQITVRVLPNTASGIGVGGTNELLGTIDVTVDPVNDAPVVTAPSGPQTASSSDPLVFSAANGNQISVTDVDVKGVPANGMSGTDVIRVTLDPTQGWTPAPGSYGTLKLASTSGITFIGGITYDEANGHTVTSTSGAGGPLVIEGTIDDVNAALNGLSYTPPANIDRTIQLRVTADDRENGGTGARTDAETVLINASSDNDPPEVTVPAAQTVAEDTTLAFTGARQISISDPDDFGSTMRAELRVTNGTLSVTNTSGVTGNNSATLVIEGTEAHINAVLAGLSYRGMLNFNGSDSLEVKVFDNGNTGTRPGSVTVPGADYEDGSSNKLVTTRNVDITVTPVNDAPVFGNLAGPITYVENGAGVRLDADATISDVELSGRAGGDGDWNGAVLTIARYSNGAFSPNANDIFETTGTLAFVSTGTGTGDVVVGGTTVGSWSMPVDGRIEITFNGNATDALVASVLQQITYRHDGDAPPASLTLRIQIDDGNTGIPDQGSGGNEIATYDLTVNVNRHNDQPGFNGLDNRPTYVEDQPAVVIDGDVDLYDAELDAADNWNGATLTLRRDGGANGQDVFQGSGTLSFTGTGSGNVELAGTVVGTYSTTAGQISISFNSQATSARVDAVAQQIAYRNTSQDPPASVTLAWIVNDGGTNASQGGSAQTFTATTVVDIIPVNDAPTLTGLPASVSYVEGAAPTRIGPVVTLGDVDSANFDGGSLRLELTSGGEAADRLSIRNQGTGTGQIGFDGTTLTYGGAVIGTVTGGDGTDPLVVTFTSTAATRAVVEALVENLTFANTSEHPDTAPRTARLTIVDGDGTANGGADTYVSPDITLTVSRVNDAPALSGLGGTVGHTEGGIATVLAPGAALSDVDLDTRGNWSGAVLTLERQGGADANDLFEGSGTLSLAGNGDVVVGGTTVGTWSAATAGRLQITFNTSATPALVDQVAQSIAYRYAGDAPPASVVIGWTISDGNTGVADQGSTGIPLTGTGSVTVELTAVNDAPVLDPAASPALNPILEDAGAPVAGVASGTLVSSLVGGITDPDLTPGRGIAIVGADASQGTWWFSTDGGASWTALGTPGENAARLLEADADTRLHFQPSADWNGELPSALTIRAWDLSAGTNGGTMDVTASGTGGTSPFSTATDTVSLTVTPVNDAPTLTGLPTATTFTEGGTPVLVGPSATLGDIDSPDFGGGSLTVSIVSNGQGTDVLSIRDQGAGAGQIGFDGTTVTYGGTVIGTVSGGSGGLPLVIGLNAAATRDAVQALTRNLTFENTSSYPSSQDRTVRIAVVDGDGTANGGADSVQTDTVVQVQRVNDRPVLTGLGGPVSYVEGSAGIVLAGGAGVGDAELGPAARDDWSGAVLTLSREVGGVPAPQAQDRFGATGTLQLTGGDVIVGGVTIGTWSEPVPGQIRIAFGTGATTALVDQVVSQLTYANDALLLPASISIGWWLDDGNTGDADQGTGGALTASGSVTVLFDNVNDPPVNTAPTGVTTSEDTPFTFQGSDLIRISDPDAGNAVVSVSLIATGGTVTLSGTSGLTFTTGDGTADPVITMTGTIADINAALDGLVFAPGQHFGGAASLRIVTDDLGNTGSGGALQDDVTVAITVTPVPDAPLLAVEPVVVTEDRTVLLPISPALVDADGSETLSIEISGIPAGAVFANTAGDTLVPVGGVLVLTPGQLAGLRITPPPHSDVDFALTVTARATETANGTSATTVRTLPVQVVAEADAPLLTVAPASGAEDSGIPLGISTGLVDADGSESLSIVISGIPAGSSLTNAAGDTLVVTGGTLMLAPTQLAGLTILPPADRDTGFTLTVTAITTEAENGDTARTVRLLPVDIVPVPDAPRAMDGLPDRATIEESKITYALPPGLFQEVDSGDAVTISARLAGGGALPPWLSFDPATGVFVGSPMRGHAGTYLIEVVATDMTGRSIAVPYTLVVTPAPNVVMPEAPVRPADPAPPFVPGGSTGSTPGGLITPGGNMSPPLITGPDGGEGDGYGSGPSDFPSLRDPNALLSQGGLDFGSFNSRLELLLVGSPGNRVILPETNTVFQVPRTIFRHSNPGERLSFEAKRPDGEPIPSWLRFDPETLTFTGTAPASAEGGLDIVIIARDSRGNQAAAPFRITITRDVGQGNLQGQAVPLPATPEQLPAAQETQDGQEDGNTPPPVTPEGEQPPAGDEAPPPERRAAAEPASFDGAPALSAQIRLAGRAGLYAEGRALLGSLANAPEPAAPRDMQRLTA